MNDIFSEDRRQKIENAVKEYLESDDVRVPKEVQRSPRAVGDWVQELVAKILKVILESEVTRYEDELERKSTGDIEFTLKDGTEVFLDVKTHNVDTKFNMPNLTAIEKLIELYAEDRNVFAILIISYSIHDQKFQIRNTYFVPIEWLSWNCLRISSLGLGQIQLKNSNEINLIENGTRKDWMIEFSDFALDFFPRQIQKAEKGITKFMKIKEEWKNR